MLLLDSREVEFKLDTGAEVTVISETMYETLGAPLLEKPSKALYGPTHQSLKVLGQFTGTLKHQDRSSTQAVFVVRNLKMNLLGLPAITSLQLLQRVDTTTSGEVDFRKQFPDVVRGLGTLGGDYQIQLKEGAVPYVLYTPRHVALLLKNRSCNA